MAEPKSEYAPVDIETPHHAIAIATSCLRYLRAESDPNPPHSSDLRDRANRLEITILKLTLAYDMFDAGLFPCLMFDPETDE